jgi:hypothetical protein
MPIIIEDVECPQCGEHIDVEFEPDQEINDVDCPECNAELTVASYDPTAKTVQLTILEDEGQDDEEADTVEMEGDGEEEDEEPEG